MMRSVPMCCRARFRATLRPTLPAPTMAMSRASSTGPGSASKPRNFGNRALRAARGSSGCPAAMISWNSALAIEQLRHVRIALLHDHRSPAARAFRREQGTLQPLLFLLLAFQVHGRTAGRADVNSRIGLESDPADRTFLADGVCGG